ncbi:MAG: hypothetical protein J07HX5_02046 [halophilic archaeon J07HX5]|nr:MAG: hypothetical protein J07HX5_02046 [halophilic archaeon J07HX5]
MSQRAVIACRQGEQTTRTPSFRAIVTALGHRIVDEREQQRQEHNRYNLGPGLVDELSQIVDERDCGYVAVDNQLHPGQLSDLTAALAPATVRDCRGVVYERLANGGNRAAANRRDAQQLRGKRRRLLADNRERRQQPRILSVNVSDSTRSSTHSGSDSASRLQTGKQRARGS